MNKLFTIFAAILLTASVFAQSPEKMSYQAVIRDALGNFITEQEIGMQISILQSTADGTAVYVEKQTPTTNPNGLVSIEIGAGTVVNGDFTAIDWANGPYFIKTETAIEAPLTTYTITGTSQLLSVPYALHAKTAQTVTETQTLADVLLLSNDGNANQIKNIADPTDGQDAATKAYVDDLLARIEALEEADLLKSGFIDARDGNHYDVVKIGNQIWMAENMAYSPSSGNYWAYDNDNTNVDIYGYLYDWQTALSVCPVGWHLPSDDEWAELIDYIGGISNAGTMLKATSGWDYNGNGVDNYGFTALPGGKRASNDGAFIYIGSNGKWWGATEAIDTHAWVRSIYGNVSGVDRSGHDKEDGNSVRCVR